MKNLLKKIPVLLLLIVLLSVILNLLFLSKEGFGNLYYSATVKSMLTGFKNFFFASFDPAGFVSVDKPPLGLWIQSIFVLLFGFSGISMILPQAIAGVLSVVFMYILINEIFDKRSGLIAAFVLAITPVFVALSRNNTMDMQVVFLSVLSSWTFFKAIKKKSFKYLILTFVLTGLGFNIKMLLAFTALPAVGLVWLLSNHIPFKKRFVQIIFGGIVLIVVSLSWIFIVDLYPKENRPYVGSTENNSAFELAFSYNGLLRIISPFLDKDKKPVSASVKNFYFFALGGPPAMIDESGNPGILRLFNKELAGQESWFLPFIFLGLIFSLMRIKKDEKIGADIKKLSIIYWFLWLVPYMLYLSFTKGIFHRHYVVAIVPPIAALCGIYAVKLWDSYCSKEKSGFFLPVSILMTGLFHYYIVRQYAGLPQKTGLIVLIVSIIISVYMFLNKMMFKLDSKLSRMFLYVPVITLFSVLPFYWSCTPLIYRGNIALPYASPDLFKDSTKGRRFISRDGSFVPEVKVMYDFFLKNKTNEEFLVGIPSSYAYGVTLLLYKENKNDSVMTIGGFTGKDPILNIEELKKYINAGKIRYFFIPAYLGSQDQKGNAKLYNWIKENGKLVDKKLWLNRLIPLLISAPLDLYDMK